MFAEEKFEWIAEMLFLAVVPIGSAGRYAEIDYVMGRSYMMFL